MSKRLSRAELIRGRLSRSAKAFRSPYALSEASFRSLCSKCDACREACETGIIGKDRDGFPKLRFGHAHCTFCGVCAKACQTGALKIEQLRNWTAKAHIKNTCLSLNAITCRTCEERCGESAIRFKLMTGGRAAPLIDEAACTGCGSCAVICPTQSIAIQSFEKKEDAA